MGVMSPDATKFETAGMEEAHEYFMRRPWMKSGLCKTMGEGYFKRMCALENYEKADGFRRWAYMVAQQRAAAKTKSGGYSATKTNTTQTGKGLAKARQCQICQAAYSMGKSV